MLLVYVYTVSHSTNHACTTTHTHTHTHDMLLVYVCVCNTYCNLLYYIACTTIHTPCATEQGLGLVEIGSVDRDFNFTYLPGEEENSWPGRL